MDRMPERLLAADDPEAITCPTKTVGRRLIVTDLAGNCLPRTLSGLGIPETELGRHIAWDIGIGAVSRLMADALGAASTRPHRAAIGPPRAIREPVQADLVKSELRRRSNLCHTPVTQIPWPRRWIRGSSSLARDNP